MLIRKSPDRRCSPAVQRTESDKKLPRGNWQDAFKLQRRERHRALGEGRLLVETGTIGGILLPKGAIRAQMP